MVASWSAEIRRRLGDARESWFLAGLTTVTLLGLWARLAGLSRGSFYRDDAWVALTSRVPWHDAWRMVGTAPGFVLLERWWVGLSAPSTWWAQLPTLVGATLAIPLAAVVARWWRLRPATALLVATLLAFSHVDIEYATHLKPYGHDLVAGTLVLAGAEFWRRGRSAWPFAVVSLGSLAMSFSVAPVVVGCAAVMATRALREGRLGSLRGPGALVAAPGLALYLAVRGGISPRLTRSWAPYFFDWHSLRALAHSAHTVVLGLLWGFTDTAPRWHLAGLGTLVILGTILAVALSLTHLAEAALPLAALATAGLFAAAHLAPLGTGRTDAYLYPALALCVALGVERAVTWLRARRRLLGHLAVAGVLAVVAVTAADQLGHRTPYPGGSIDPVAAAAHRILDSGGGVLVEGTARWPWTYYEDAHVRLFFSDRYNTGFAPLSDDPRVEVMPGTSIEGGYDPRAAVAALQRFCRVLYVRTDDWSALGDPLHGAFTAAGYRETRFRHPAGYLLEWLARPCTASS